MAKNFYAIETSEGKRIFQNWDDCKKFRDRAPSGAKYHGFDTHKEAEAFLGQIPESAPECFSPAVSIRDDRTAVAYVDGSYNQATKVYGFGIVFFWGNSVQTAGGSNTAFSNARNVAGEVEAAVHAIEMAIQRSCTSITIFHDYEGIEAWATKRWKANTPVAKWYVSQIENLRAKINISFKKVAAHTGVQYNEEADRIAKQSVGIV